MMASALDWIQLKKLQKNALKFENLSFDCDYKEDKEMPKVQDQEASENEPLNLLRNSLEFSSTD